MSTPFPLQISPLSELIYPLKIDQFIKQYWHRQHLFQKSLSYRNEDLLKEIGSLDIDRLVYKSGGNPIIVWLKNCSGKQIGTTVSPSSAITLYESGATLYFHLQLTPYLKQWKSELTDELGVEGCELSIFATKAGGITPMHFDANNNFTLQLKGAKKWIISGNDSVQYPTKNWMSGTEVPSEIRYYCPENLEDKLPNNPEVVELTKGSGLYIPQGYWHGTETSCDSISLNVMVPPSSWAKLITERIYSTLLTEERWRQHTSMHKIIDSKKEDYEDKLVTLLSELTKLVEGLEIADIIYKKPSKKIVDPKSDHELFRPRLARWHVNTKNNLKNEFDVSFIPAAGRMIVITLDLDMLNIVRKIDKLGYRCFTIKDLEHINVPTDELVRFINVLLDLGFLRMI